MEKSTDDILAICSIFSIFFFLSTTAGGTINMQHRLDTSPLANGTDMSQTVYECLINLRADSPLEMPDCFCPLRAESLKPTAEANQFTSTKRQNTSELITKDHFRLYRTTANIFKYNKFNPISSHRMRTLGLCHHTKPHIPSQLQF